MKTADELEKEFQYIVNVLDDFFKRQQHVNMRTLLMEMKAFVYDCHRYAYGFDTHDRMAQIVNMGHSIDIQIRSLDDYVKMAKVSR